MDYKTASAQRIYDHLEKDREAFESRAERYAALTIPALFPRRGHVPTKEFIYPENSIGGRGVTHLSSRLLLTLLPVSGRFYRLVPDSVGQSILAGGNEDMMREVEQTLATMERETQRAIETQGLRVPTADLLQHLIVVGSVLMKMPDEGGMMYHTLREHVVDRDKSDNVLVIVIKETVAFDSLDPEFQAHVMATDVSDTTQDSMRQVDIYTKVWLHKKGRYKVHQEINQEVVEGTEGSYLEEDLPYRPLRWKRVKGQQYGRPLCEEVFGDLLNAEYLSKAITEGSLAASRVLMLVSPTGTTDPKDLNDAENGEFVFGNADDISSLQLEKFSDMRIAAERLDRIVSSLQASFLLNISATRDAERVTAEEIRLRASELESALGGVYSQLSQEMQLPIVRRLLRQLEKQEIIPEFIPELKEHVKPAIVAGLESMGRSADLEKLKMALGTLQGIIGPELLAQTVDQHGIAQFVFTNVGIPIEGIIKSPEQIQEEQQAAQQQAMMSEVVSKGTAPVAKAAVEGGADTEVPEGE